MSEKLKPCPFCGGEVSIVESMHKGRYVVRCPNWKCNATYEPDSLSAAIKAWNRRPKCTKA